MSADPHSAARRSARRTRLLAALVLLPTVLAVLAATLGPLTSGDLWWHLRTGEWIVQHGHLPSTDPFSHTAGTTHWILQEYGSQLLFALVFRLAGFTALKLLGALLSLSILAVVYSRARAELRPSWAVLLTAAFALLFALKWELRPQLFSVLFFFWLERCLFPRGRAQTTRRFSAPSPRRWLELLVLAMVWTQLHAEALFAPLVTLAVFTGALIATLRENAGRRHAAAWFAMAAAALLGTLISPLWIEPHVYALVGRGVPQTYIEEWFRPWVLPGDPRFVPLTLAVFLAFWCALLVGAGFALFALLRRFTRRDGSSWERLAFLAACLLFALSARRFFWLAWFPLLDASAYFVAARRPLRAGRLLPDLGALALGLALLFTHYPASALESVRAGRAGDVVDAALFPRFAAEFTRDAGLTGNLFHPYEWGGYLGFVTELPVFIDGRTVLFEKIIQERWLAEHDPGQRKAIFQARTVEVICFDHFVDTADGPRPWQPGDGRWLPVWTDDRAVVWVLHNSENAARATRWWQRVGATLDPKDGITVADVNLAQPRWLEERGLLPPAVLARLRAIEEAPGSPSLASVYGRTKLWGELGMRKNQRAELRNVVRQGAAFQPVGHGDKTWAALLDADDLDEFQRQLAWSAESAAR